MEDNNKNNSQQIDRKLGDKWENWDGKAGKNISKSGKKLFLGISFLGILLISLMLFLVWYMILPRMEEFGPFAVTITSFIFVLVSFLFIFWYGILILSILRKQNYLVLIAPGATAYLSKFIDKVIWLGKFLGFNRDAVSHSFIKINNELMATGKYKNQSERLLVLVPRCITPDQVKSTRAICELYKCEFFIAAGGEAAREKVLNFRPDTVIGVACERDLVSGIKDILMKVPVVGIANERPEGPCKNTKFDIDELEKYIKYFRKSE